MMTMSSPSSTVVAKISRVRNGFHQRNGQINRQQYRRAA